jgi:hypothetical protein
MNRRDFLRRMGWPVLTAAGVIMASGFLQPAEARGRRGRSSGGGGNQSQGSTGGASQAQGSAGAGNQSNVSGLDLGSGRFKQDNPTQGGSGLIGDDVGAFQGSN